MRAWSSASRIRTFLLSCWGGVEERRVKLPQNLLRNQTDLWSYRAQIVPRSGTRRAHGFVKRTPALFGAGLFEYRNGFGSAAGLDNGGKGGHVEERGLIRRHAL